MELPPDDLCDDLFFGLTVVKSHQAKRKRQKHGKEVLVIDDELLPPDDVDLFDLYDLVMPASKKRAVAKPKAATWFTIESSSAHAGVISDDEDELPEGDGDVSDLHGLLMSCMPAGPCKVALTEIFSPPRFVKRCQEIGLPATHSWDLTTGWNANNPADLQEVETYLNKEDPELTTMSPECTMFSIMQRNCNLKKMMETNPLEVERRMAEAIRHFDWCIEIARQRAAKGRKFLLEHPSSASSWNLRSVLQLCQDIPGCRFCCFAQCRYGLKGPGADGKPMRKLTKFLTNSDAIYQEFHGKKCLCRSQGLVHQKIEGSINGVSLSKFAQIYPAPLVQAVVSCCQREFLNH
jgi:hypothetical protein